MDGKTVLLLLLILHGLYACEEQEEQNKPLSEERVSAVRPDSLHQPKVSSPASLIVFQRERKVFISNAPESLLPYQDLWMNCPIGIYSAVQSHSEWEIKHLHPNISLQRQVSPIQMEVHFPDTFQILIYPNDPGENPLEVPLGSPHWMSEVYAQLYLLSINQPSQMK